MTDDLKRADDKLNRMIRDGIRRAFMRAFPPTHCRQCGQEHWEGLWCGDGAEPKIDYQIDEME